MTERKPWTDGEIAEAQRAFAIETKRYEGKSLPLADCTCHDCGCVRLCDWAYDAFNTHGDCIESR